MTAAMTAANVSGYSGTPLARKLGIKEARHHRRHRRGARRSP